MDFSEKVTTGDFLTRVMPGGFFIAVVFFGFNLQNNIVVSAGNLDFLYSFLFFCSAFIVGEIIQTIAHMFEFIVDIFFKGYRPSEIFIFKGNPIITNNRLRLDLIEKLNLSDDERNFFNKTYKSLPIVYSRNKNARRKSQRLFWKIFSEVEDETAIQKSNINYLFLRVAMTEFLLLAPILLWVNKTFSVMFLVVFIILLWRARGLAKGLVFKSVNIYLKK